MKCEDCSHAEMCKWIDELEGRGCDFGEPCEDAISREAALNTINAMRVACDTNDIADYYILLLEAFKQLSSATPSRHKGHWIEERDDYGEIQGWHCDKCYEDSGFTTDCKWHFCPNCGAEMSEKESENDR